MFILYQIHFYFVLSAWIEEANIKPYETHKEQLIKSCKSASFKEAVGQIEAYIKDPEVNLFFCRIKTLNTHFLFTYIKIVIQCSV